MAIVGSEDEPRASQIQALKKVMPMLLRVVVVKGATHVGERGTLNRPEFIQALREMLSSRGRLSGGALR